MFDKSSVMVLLENNSEIQICKLEMDKETQIAICSKYADTFRKMYNEKEQIMFNGKYKPEQDEILYIDGYEIDGKILDSVKETSGIPSFIPHELIKDKIKSIFVGEVKGEKVNIVFQKFKKEQYISNRGMNLFFDKETFREEKRFGICISNEIDCIYTEGKMMFDSYFIARQIFDLRDYYRIATDREVDEFTKLDKINFDNADVFKGQANSIIRKKIASIMDSKIFDNYSAGEIKKRGKQTGIEIHIKDKKVVIPADKKQMKIVLGFLDEEVYKGVFSKDTFITNSKRVVC